MFSFSKQFNLVLFAVFLVFLLIHSANAAPAIINYQGTLTDDAGLPVNANKDMTFKIYSNIDDTTALWTSTITGVVVKNGIFSQNLGEQDAFPTGLFDDDSLYLGVTVDGTELVPRKRLTSVPYAMNSEIPKGGIIMWSGAVNQIPAGWALCNGVERTLPDGSKITPPNLMERFIVGAGSTNYPVGKTGGIEKHLLTIGEMPSHSHTQNPHRHKTSNYNDGGNTLGYATTNAYPHGNANYWNFNNPGYSDDFTATINNTGGGAAHENRPPYYALCFIMKL